MFFKKLNEKIDNLEREMTRLGNKIYMLECPHKPEYLKIERDYWFYGKKSCINCGKVIARYSNEKDYLSACIELMSKKIDISKKELKELASNG